MTLPTTLTAAITRFADAGRVLVATDFDGVLAPLVLDPSASRPLPGSIDVLRSLATLDGVTVAVVSGRDLATLRTLTGLEDGDGVVLIGSHGGEASEPLSPGTGGSSASLTQVQGAALTAAQSALEAIVRAHPEARIEHKPAGVVLHTRGMDEDQARAAEDAALAIPDDVLGVSAMRGKSVVELSVLDTSKGSALAALAGRVDARATAYLGDDVTDETVFRTLPHGGQDLTVKVGEGETAAEHRIASCEDAVRVLTAVRDALHK